MRDALISLQRKMRQSLGCGDFEIRPFLERAEGRSEPESMELRQPPDARLAHLLLTYADGIREDLFFSFEENGIVCKRHTANRGPSTLRLRETGLTLDGLTFGGPTDRDYFYHVENPRIYGRFAIPVRIKRTATLVQDSGFDELACNRWADPGVAGERIGASPYQPFPAILLSNFNAAHGLVHGTLSQQIFFHNYKTEHRNSRLCLDVLGSFKAVAHRELPPGKVLQDVWYLGRTEQAADFQALFSGYIRCLKKHLPPLWGATAINRHSLVWGSWNDGIFRDIDQDRLLRTAGFLAKHFPTVQWMQIDDGYARWATDLNKAHGLGMPYEGADGVDKDKFPDGLKAFTDQVRERGLRPAVWIGGFVPHETPLY
ncbi:MAG: hypothetical protein U1E27_01150, partial [Kiritimatiellia bacterium]|nr:hypothetical protein [Kiritimatiellia bacterium]